jgi:hypothetical protein
MEFSAYGPQADLVRDLVDHDKKANAFFRSANTTLSQPDKKNVDVAYFEDFTVALKYAMSGNGMLLIVVATTIGLCDRDTITSNRLKIGFIHAGSERWNRISGKRKRNPTYEKLVPRHSVVLIHDVASRKLYLYDPNGSYDDQAHVAKFESRYTYDEFGTQASSTTAFQAVLQSKIPQKSIAVAVPETTGIQNSPHVPYYANSKYIRNGGYCMFYNWCAIRYICENVLEASEDEPFDMTAVFNTLTGASGTFSTSPYPFPAKRQLPKKTRQIVAEMNKWDRVNAVEAA